MIKPNLQCRQLYTYRSSTHALRTGLDSYCEIAFTHVVCIVRAINLFLSAMRVFSFVPSLYQSLVYHLVGAAGYEV